jgi:3-oxoacyl-[acyl-carrier-protein] synthase-3
MPDLLRPALALHTILSGINLRGVVAAMPSNIEDADTLASMRGYENAHKIAAATGIHTRHLAPEGMTACDLGEAAAKELLQGLQWTSESIDLLVVVTQTPDYPLPGNSPILQYRLGLRQECGTLDINSGCSGFIDGLWAAASMLFTSSGTRGLLIVGDTTSQFVSITDHNTRPLFGDCVAAIGIEKGADKDMFVGIVPGVDGSGAPYLTVIDGASRNPLPNASFGRLFMDGPQVLAFALRQVPKNISTVMQVAGWEISDVDHFLLHQANEAMIRHLTKKTGFSDSQMVLALADAGNTSSASIPLAITSLGESLVQTQEPRNLLMSGFGVGWRWSSAVWRTAPLNYCNRVLLS